MRYVPGRLFDRDDREARAKFKVILVCFLALSVFIEVVPPTPRVGNFLVLVALDFAGICLVFLVLLAALGSGALLLQALKRGYLRLPLRVRELVETVAILVFIAFAVFIVVTDILAFIHDPATFLHQQWEAFQSLGYCGSPGCF